jgi:DNA-binding NtrC family response regulator
MENPTKILVIDDEIDICESIRDILKEEFPLVDIISNSTEAIQALKDASYSLILSDVAMPQLPGPELIRLVRSQGNLVPVIFISAYISKEVALTALRLGVADVVEKPFKIEHLMEAVKRVLEIDRRKTQFIIDNATKNSSQENLDKQRKMLGLLHVVNEKKKTG